MYQQYILPFFVYLLRAIYFPSSPAKEGMAIKFPTIPPTEESRNTKSALVILFR
jgi:hypothetical protein